MFAIALAASWSDNAPRLGTVDALLGAWPRAPIDGRAVASAPSAAAGVLRWAVVERDRRGAPRWDPERQLLFVGDVRLYNRADLFRQLDVGAAPGEATDADIAWHAYLRWGEDCPKYLVGDFSFAIWDERTRSLFAARDHFGVRPL